MLHDNSNFSKKKISYFEGQKKMNKDKSLKMHQDQIYFNISSIFKESFFCIDYFEIQRFFNFSQYVQFNNLFIIINHLNRQKQNHMYHDEEQYQYKQQSYQEISNRYKFDGLYHYYNVIRQIKRNSLRGINQTKQIYKSQNLGIQSIISRFILGHICSLKFHRIIDLCAFCKSCTLELSTQKIQQLRNRVKKRGLYGQDLTTDVSSTQKYLPSQNNFLGDCLESIYGLRFLGVQLKFNGSLWARIPSRNCYHQQKFADKSDLSERKCQNKFEILQNSQCKHTQYNLEKLVLRTIRKWGLYLGKGFQLGKAKGNFQKNNKQKDLFLSDDFEFYKNVMCPFFHVQKKFKNSSSKSYFFCFIFTQTS